MARKQVGLAPSNLLDAVRYTDLGPSVDYVSRLNTALSGSGTFGPIQQVIFAASPPVGSGLTAVSADGATDDAPRVQAMLTWIKNNWGAGTVVLPAGKAHKWNSQVNIPANVNLEGGNYNTSLECQAMTSGAALYAKIERESTPIKNLRLNGPSTGEGNKFTVGAIDALRLEGSGGRIENVIISFFRRGFDIAQEATYIWNFYNCYAGRCAVGVFADYAGAYGGTPRSNAGERMTFIGCTFANSQSNLKASGGGCGIFFEGCSFDYSREIAAVSDAHVFYNNCHLESNKQSSDPNNEGWGTVNDYLINPSNYARLYFTNCNIIMGGTGVYHLINPASAPTQRNFGSIHYRNVTAYFNNTAGAGEQTFSENLQKFSATGATTLVHRSFLTSKWTPVTVRPVMMDGDAQQAVTPRVTAQNFTTGEITVTLTGGAPTDWTWVQIEFV